jgi:hypothetical protein
MAAELAKRDAAQGLAFMHSVTVGQGILQLARDNEDARQEAQRVLQMAVEFLHRKS